MPGPVGPPVAPVGPYTRRLGPGRHQLIRDRQGVDPCLVAWQFIDVKCEKCENSSKIEGYMGMSENGVYPQL